RHRSRRSGLLRLSHTTKRPGLHIFHVYSLKSDHEPATNSPHHAARLSWCCFWDQSPIKLQRCSVLPFNSRFRVMLAYCLGLETGVVALLPPTLFAGRAFCWSACASTSENLDARRLGSHSSVIRL